MKFSNLKITAAMKNSVVLADPLRLDCILSAAKAKEILKDEYYTNQKQAGDAGTVIETLSQFIDFFDLGKIFYTSFGFFNDDDKEFSISYSKRWNGLHDELVQFKGKGKAEIDTARGEFKSYHNHLTYKTSKCVTFYARGDKEKISQLLNDYIHFLGKKSSQGFGAVKEWIVEEIEQNYSLIKDGKPMRYIPISLVDYFNVSEYNTKEAALIPPAWRSDYRDICFY